MNFLMGAWDGHESLFEMQLLLSPISNGATKTKQKCSRRDEIFTMGGYRICTCGESGGPLISARSAERVIGRLNELRARFKFELGSEALWNLERRAKRLKTGRAEGIFIRKLKCQKLLRVRRAHLSFSSNVPLQLKILGPI